MQLRRDLASDRRHVERLVLGRAVTRFEACDEQQRVGQPAQIVDRDEAVAQHRGVRFGQRAVRAVGRLAQRHRQRGQRRAQVVRERVDEIANDVLAFAERFVAFGQLAEQARLAERVDRYARKTARRLHRRVVGRLVAEGRNQHAVRGSTIGDRNRDRRLRSQPLEDEPSDRIDRSHDADRPVFGHAVDKRDDLR